MTILQLCTAAFPAPTQVTRGDWRVQDSGVNNFAVLFPGEYGETDTSPRGEETVQMAYTTKLLLGFRYQGDKATHAEIIRVRDLVVPFLRQYKRLVRANPRTHAILGKITSDGDPVGVGAPDAAPQFVYQYFTIPTVEMDAVTII